MEVTQVLDGAAATDATHVALVCVAETSAQEAAVPQDSTALHFRDTEDRAPWSRVRLKRGC
jgi:hypothetical protein